MNRIFSSLWTMACISEPFRFPLLVCVFRIAPWVWFFQFRDGLSSRSLAGENARLNLTRVALGFRFPLSAFRFSFILRLLRFFAAKFSPHGFRSQVSISRYNWSFRFPLSAFRFSFILRFLCFFAAKFSPHGFRSQVSISRYNWSFRFPLSAFRFFL
jgi:hypothetical protein